MAIFGEQRQYSGVLIVRCGCKSGDRVWTRPPCNRQGRTDLRRPIARLQLV